ncbi:MAG TPA: hypothetical protein VIY48_19315 [Candidatus Paceibacterota bacterium]
MATQYDPAKQPCDPAYSILPIDETLPLNGPGGSTILRENNEKGILETNLAYYTKVKYAELGSNHDACKQGVYATNSVGDND